MSPSLHVMVIKLKTAQPRIVWNSIKMRIILELLIEDVQFQLIIMLLLVLLYAGKYRLNYI